MHWSYIFFCGNSQNKAYSICTIYIKILSTVHLHNRTIANYYFAIITFFVNIFSKNYVLATIHKNMKYTYKSTISINLLKHIKT